LTDIELRRNPYRTCEHCGERYARHTYDDGMEKPNAFRRRRYCSQSCAQAAQIGEFKRADPPWIVDEETGCWIWQRHMDKWGYGYLSREGRRQAAHRWLYEQLVGPVPDGLVLDHLCERPSCVNPAHLEPVTRKENLRRSTKFRAYYEEKRRARGLSD
jgi:hypothetical protein